MCVCGDIPSLNSSMELSDLLTTALQNLKKEDSLEDYLQKLKSELYTTTADLKLALQDDGTAWSDIPIPGRLKLELKRLILNAESAKDVDRRLEALSVSTGGNVDKSSEYTRPRWIRCYSIEHQALYFYHRVSGRTQWEDPGEEYMDDISVNQSYAAETHVSKEDFDSSANGDRSIDPTSTRLALNVLDREISGGSEISERYQSPIYSNLSHPTSNHTGSTPSSPQEDQFFSPTVEASPLPWPSCPPYSDNDNVIAVNAQIYSNGSNEYVPSAVVYTDENGEISHAEDEFENEGEGSETSENIQERSRISPSGLIRSATKGVLNALGARNRSINQDSVPSSGSVHLNGDEEYDEHGKYPKTLPLRRPTHIHPVVKEQSNQPKFLFFSSQSTHFM